MFQKFLEVTKINEILPLTESSVQLGKTTCSDDSALQDLCLSIIYYTSGHNPRQLNTVSFLIITFNKKKSIIQVFNLTVIFQLLLAVHATTLVFFIPSWNISQDTSSLQSEYMDR